MRLILLLTLIASTLTLVGQDWKNLDRDNFSVKYPSNWELNETGVMGMTFGLFSPQTSSEDLFRENVNLVMQDLTGMGMDLDKFTALSSSQIKSFITNAEFKVNERMGDYHKVIYDGDQGQFNLRFEQYYWIKNDKAYILTFTSERNQFEKYQKTGEQILSSFKIKQG